MSKYDVAKQIDEGVNEGLDLQEISWCETYLRTASIRQACKEALLDVDSAKRMLNKPVVQSYIMNKSLAYKNLKDESLSREDLKKILNNIAQDPTTNPELRLNAVSKLNAMLEFDASHKDELLEVEEEDDIKLTVEEAEHLLNKKEEMKKERKTK